MRPCEQAFVLVSGKWKKGLFPFLFRWPSMREVAGLSRLGWAAPCLPWLQSRHQYNSPLQTPGPQHTQLSWKRPSSNQRHVVHSDPGRGFLVAHGSASHLNRLISQEKNAGKIQSRITLPVQSWTQRAVNWLLQSLSARLPEGEGARHEVEEEADVGEETKRVN